VNSWYDLDPVEGKVKNFFGDTKYIVNFFPVTTRTEDQHHGIDYLTPKEEYLIASSNGKIVKTGSIQRYFDGRTPELFVELNHNQGFLTTYNHIDSVLVSPGDKVYRGQIIAFTGNSGLNIGLVRQGIIGVHFDEYNKIKPGETRDESRVQLDPYRDQTENPSEWSNKLSLWSVDNLPIYNN